MRFQRSAAPRDNERAILPLTNIVFLLLIFFLLAGRLAQPSAFSIHPPQSVSQAPLTGHATTVELDREGHLAVDGRPVAFDDLAAAIKSRPDNAPVVQLKADGREDATRVVAVMQALHQAGVKRVRLVTAVKRAR